MQEWKQNYATLLAHKYCCDKFKRKLHVGGKPFSDLLDADLLQYLLDERIEGSVVSNLSLREKAREINKAGAQRLQNNDNFSASAGNETNLIVLYVKISYPQNVQYFHNFTSVGTVVEKVHECWSLLWNK